jgi:hypothetical protein
MGCFYGMHLNKRLNFDIVMLSWFWQTTQKATPTHCVLGIMEGQ